MGLACMPSSCWSCGIASIWIMQIGAESSERRVMRLHNQAREVTLVCPACRVELTHSHSYLCPLCGTQYPFRSGVLRMLGQVDEQEQKTRAAFDFEHRQFERARYLRISSTLVDDWLLDVQLAKEYFVGRTVLDLGCGSGRW